MFQLVQINEIKIFRIDYTAVTLKSFKPDKENNNISLSSKPAPKTIKFLIFYK